MALERTNRAGLDTGQELSEASSLERRYGGTPRNIKFPVAGTAALVPELVEDGTEPEIYPAIPREATSPRIMRGKSLTQWGIERRRAAKALKEQWLNDLTPKVGSPAFAVGASNFVDTVNGLIQLYTGIYHEETFAGILVLVRDALVGRNFVAAEEGRLAEPIDYALDTTARSSELSMVTFDEVLEKFIQAGFQK